MYSRYTSSPLVFSPLAHAETESLDPTLKTHGLSDSGVIVIDVYPTGMVFVMS